MCVSILILLDVVLEDVNWLEEKVETLCFNPYSVGCCSGRSTSGHVISFMPCFNPYSVGCCSGRNRHRASGNCRKWFQSLFCWMLFWKLNVHYNGEALSYVSILILLDVVLEDSQGVLTPVFYPSFNPYSVGCCSGRGRLNRPLFVTG